MTRSFGLTDEMHQSIEGRLREPIDPVRVLIWGSFTAGVVASWIAIGWGLLKVLT